MLGPRGEELTEVGVRTGATGPEPLESAWEDVLLWKALGYVLSLERGPWEGRLWVTSPLAAPVPSPEWC